MLHVCHNTRSVKFYQSFVVPSFDSNSGIIQHQLDRTRIKVLDFCEISTVSIGLNKT